MRLYMHRNLKRYLQQHPECVILGEQSSHRPRAPQSATSLFGPPVQQGVLQGGSGVVPQVARRLPESAPDHPKAAVFTMSSKRMEPSKPPRKRELCTPRLDIAPRDGEPMMSPPSPLPPRRVMSSADFDVEFAVLDEP